MPPLHPSVDSKREQDSHQHEHRSNSKLLTDSPSITFDNSSDVGSSGSSSATLSSSSSSSSCAESTSSESGCNSLSPSPTPSEELQVLAAETEVLLSPAHELQVAEVNRSVKAVHKSKAATEVLTYIKDGDFDIVWINVIAFVIAHLLHFYSIYLLLTNHETTVRYTWFFGYWVGFAGGLGITAGAHRLWSHKSYSAKLPLRIFLMIGQCIAGQNCLYVWCRDHRVHHKFSETDGDPHNTNRGFFFAHVGWLLRKKHPEMLKKAKTLDFSDLLADPVIRFQKDHYTLLYFIFAFLGPALVPLLWGESIYRSLLIVYISRYITALHSTWFVNSTAHMFGDRPYNKNIEPRENSWVSYGAFGEGYHNWHHTFPFDYATSELGCKLNLTKKFIDLMAWLGLAYNLKRPSDKLVKARIARTGVSTSSKPRPSSLSSTTKVSLIKQKALLASGH